MRETGSESPASPTGEHLPSEPTGQPGRQQEYELAVRFARLTIIVGVGYLIFSVFSPFLSAIAWAAILSYALYPVYRRIVHLTRGRTSTSAFLMCVAVTLGIILPLFYLSFFIAEDLTRTFRVVASQVKTGEGMFRDGWQDYPIVASVVARFQELERATGTDIRAAIAQNLTQLGRELVLQLTNVAKNMLLAMVQLGITLICSFYLFRDGDALVQWARENLPLPFQREHVVLQRFGQVVKGSIWGNTLVAVLEGVIGGIGFWLTGLPSPVLWGVVMGFLAYLPVVGASLIWAPAAVYLFSQAAYGKVFALCAVGLLIGVVEYFVRPISVGRASKIHTLLVFFSVLGGIKLFGLLGIVAGPLVVAVGIAVVESYNLDNATPVGATNAPPTPTSPP